MLWVIIFLMSPEPHFLFKIDGLTEYLLTYSRPDRLNPFFIVSGDPAFPWHKHFVIDADSDYE